MRQRGIRANAEKAPRVQYTAGNIGNRNNHMATMLEVAKRAGVSKATVSRVLSGNGYVSQETKDRVFQAVAESGYRPNLLALNLATKKTQTLGLVVTNTLYHGVYFSELLYHVARMTEDKGRQLILADGKHSAEEVREAIQYLLDLRCDAIIIYPRFLSVDEMDEIIENHERPIMVLNRRLRRNASHCVWSDQKASATMAVKQLHQRGVKVPEQVSVVGFDDIALAPYMGPALSSVKVPVTEMIKESINRLIFMLDGGDLKFQQTFPGELIERDSMVPGPHA